MEREETEEKESVRKTEKERHEMKYKVGDRIKIINATEGCYGANGRVGTVTNKHSTDGLCYDKGGFNVDCGRGGIWRIGFASECELLDELTAEEAIILRAEMCETIHCSECKFSKENNGEDIYCNNFIKKYPERVVEAIKQLKKEHEKEEVEVESKLYCRIIDVDDDSTVRLEALQDGISLNDEIKEILAKYCSEHVGDYFAVCEKRWMVKQ